MENPFTVQTRDEEGNPIRYDHNLRIKESEWEIERLNTEMERIYADETLVRPHAQAYANDDPRCPKICGRFRNEHGIEGNRSCKNHCGLDHYNGVRQNNELRAGDVKRHITPLQNQIDAHKKIIKNEKEKASLPILREKLYSDLGLFRNLSITDPLYRQKKIDMEKELYEQSQEIDTLEKKWNIFANIPAHQREIITPDPIVKTLVEFEEINKRPLLIGGIIGLVGLFLIWRMA